MYRAVASLNGVPIFVEIIGLSLMTFALDFYVWSYDDCYTSSISLPVRAPRLQCTIIPYFLFSLYFLPYSITFWLIYLRVLSE